MSTNIDISELIIGEKLARGSFGTVFRTEPSPKVKSAAALKIYHPDQLAGVESAMRFYLDHLITVRKSAPEAVRRLLGYRTTWPQAVVTDGPNLVGFLMALIPDKYYFMMRTRTKGESRRIAQMDQWFKGDAFAKRIGLNPMSPIGRLTVIRRLIGTLEVLHGMGMVVGDLSCNNVLVHVNASDQTHNEILLCDVDSFKPKGMVPPLAQPHSPNFVPPEAEEAELMQQAARRLKDENAMHRFAALYKVQSHDTDVWKMGVMIARLYDDTPHNPIAASLTWSSAAETRIRRECGAQFVELLKRVVLDVPKNHQPGDRIRRPTPSELVLALFKAPVNH